MAILKDGFLYLPVAFVRESRAVLSHRAILDAAGLEGVRRRSPENLGGCLVKVFMNTVVLSGSSGDFGVMQKQEIVLPKITAALRNLFHEKKIAVHEINTDELDV